jgi:RimJ/RimL family protein N-acetyltransferase
MVTVAAPGRSAVHEVRETTDRALLRPFLERDRLFAAYAICDLDEREFGKTRWGLALIDEQPVAVALEYSGPTPQPLFVMGRPDGIAAILRSVIRPRVAYCAMLGESLPAVRSLYRIEPGPPMVRMAVNRARFRPYPANVQRLTPLDSGHLNRLYQVGFASWLPAASIANGVYYGIRVGGKLVAAAGTHVISPTARLGVVGNVLTHADHRGRGYATAVTSAVTEELLRGCDDVVLNVRSDNPPALAAYRRLGYVEHVRFEERLIHRLGPPWAGIVNPIRRMLPALPARRDRPDRPDRPDRKEHPSR